MKLGLFIKDFWKLYVQVLSYISVSCQFSLYYYWPLEIWGHSPPKKRANKANEYNSTVEILNSVVNTSKSLMRHSVCLQGAGPNDLNSIWSICSRTTKITVACD